MKICFLESAQNFGGARSAAIKMAKVLSAGSDVNIIDIYGSCKPFVEACQQSGVPFEILCDDSNPYYVRSASSLWQKIINLLLFLPHLIGIGRKLKDRLNKSKVDYVCVTGFRPLMFFFFYRPKCKVVFFAHGWYIKEQLSFKSKYLLRHCVDRIVCISEATKYALFDNKVAELKDLYVVHNSISIDLSCINPAVIHKDQKTITIMHCGGFTSGKGQMVSVSIAKRLKELHVPFKMIFAGIIYQGKESSDYLAKIKQETKKLGVDNDIEFVVNKPYVLDYMMACDILIHPSETEGFPLVVLEAQYLGKPVIANAVGGVTDMIIDNFTGFLPTHNNVEEYCVAIQKLYKDKDLYLYISNNAKDLARHSFSDYQQKQELKRVFNE